MDMIVTWEEKQQVLTKKVSLVCSETTSILLLLCTTQSANIPSAGTCTEQFKAFSLSWDI